MPSDPGANLGREKLPTNPQDIGHVAPVLEGDPRYNSLVIRAEYRVSLRLGDMDDMFADAADTTRGPRSKRQNRLHI